MSFAALVGDKVDWTKKVSLQVVSCIRVIVISKKLFLSSASNKKIFYPVCPVKLKARIKWFFTYLVIDYWCLQHFNFGSNVD